MRLSLQLSTTIWSRATFCSPRAMSAARSRSPTLVCQRWWTTRTTIPITEWIWPPREQAPIGGY